MNEQELQALLNQYLPSNQTGGVLTNPGGTPSTPTTTNPSGALPPLYQQSIQAIPYLSGAINQQIVPTAIQQEMANLATQPMAQNLIAQLYQQYGPQLQATQSQIQGQAQQGAASANASTANSAAGQGALQAAINADKAANPEYYAARSAGASSIGNLLGSIDLSGALSGSQNRAIRQALAQQNAATGNLNTPSQSQTVSNAMNYGNAVYQRQEQAKNDLGNAISQATSFLNPSQTQGFNAFNVATGNTGNAGTGASSTVFGGAGSGLGTNALGSTTGSVNAGVAGTAGEQEAQTQAGAQRYQANMQFLGGLLGGLL